MKIPHNHELEKSVLSTLAVGFDIDEIRGFVNELRAEYFFNPKHRNLFEEILGMVKNGLLPDLITLEPRLAALELDVTEFMTGALPVNMPSMTAELKSLSVKRKVLAECTELLEAAQDEMLSGREIIERSSAAITRIVQDWRERKNFKTVDTLEEATQRVIEAGQDNETASKVVYATPFMDNAVTIYRKQIHTVGGMQGTGKTAFALSAFRNQIISGQNVAYFCTESDRQEIMQRILASDMAYPVQALLEGLRGDNMGKVRLKKAVEKFAGNVGNFWIYGLGDFELAIDDIGVICKKILRDSGKLDMIYLDFLQDLNAPFGGSKMEERHVIAYNTKGFKNICVECDCAGTMLSQFNRETHNQQRPTKKSFRGSGSIDDISHLMSVLYRKGLDEAEKPLDDEPVEVWWYSVKTRLVRPWMRKLGFIGKTCTYQHFDSHRYGAADLPEDSKTKQYKD